MLCKAENFRLGLAADRIVRATGVPPSLEATTFPILSRPDALTPLRTRASARRHTGIVVAI
ncbi:MAG TPA: hypothetical protein VGL41_01505 [Roseiarcus sp.]|jgi:hypothetical protein